ncbi:UDP-glucose/GDP-mannose dehydrogenase family protein [Pradoshia eiseniae]|uniref:UDP-glucose 6-dehydrogenase n=1 Tax=Pradoshia eiseniae TaxID=2064768 RepID=A0A2S7N043_9BACI|nr:UDP-glucose/GDP-mannose dehydrogenase family protein [Pradoshia eiseniae]PQD95355.1 UDP-glucose/GDP-mannose dehydrogenase family protein [Pradoshia eiseniae]
MNICVIGAGYVGLTQAAVLADLGHAVYCVDTNKERVQSLTRGEIPIYEPGLKELVKKNKERLSFSSSPRAAIKQSSVIFIAVGTPAMPDGQTDLTYVQSVIDQLAETITSYTTIVTKSTVPPGTNEWIHDKLIEKGLDATLFSVVSNPEFLREGSALQDMFHADKIVIGKKDTDDRSLHIMKEIYKKLPSPFVVTSLSGAEMIKYTSNAFLATKISFINEIAKICDSYGVNIEDVVTGIGLDPRISPHFLQSGIGYGGSCFPKDVRSLEHSALKKNIRPLILQAVQEINLTQVDLYLTKLKETFPDMAGRKIAVLGIAFKPNTDDTRYSPAIALIEQLSNLGAEIHAYDPKAHLPVSIENVTEHKAMEEALTDADVVIIATDWDEFKLADLKRMKKLMKGTLVMDARNCLDPAAVAKVGLQYKAVARF